jgi:hypothetical protein
LVARPGIRRTRTAAALGSENAWSPQEVTMRYVWSRRHPRPLCNVPVFTRDGRHLLTPHLLHPPAGVAGEYAGVVHLQASVRRRDLNREELYRELGIEMVTMISTDLPDTSAFDRRLEAAYRRARRSVVRPWTLEQPDWWVDTSTVAARRALTAADRERWLRRLTG